MGKSAHFKRKPAMAYPEIALVIENGDVAALIIGDLEGATYRVINLDKKTVTDYNPDRVGASIEEFEKEILDEAVKHPKERTWEMWTLHEEAIKGIAGRHSLSLEGRDLDEVARQVKKGIDAALDFVWEEVIVHAIRNTKQEGVEP